MTFADFWMIFSFSFTVALSGACSPGPLLTYTVIKSAQSARRGYLMGLLIITGHAILEAVIIILLLLGFSFVLKLPAVVLAISIAGALVLVAMGVQILVSVARGKVRTDFLDRDKLQSGGTGEKKRTKHLNNPVLGGILVSMSNPYWWVWWAALGFPLMVKYEVSFFNPLALAAFFLGHEAGDLAWYIPVSVLVFLGRKKIDRRVYIGLLVVCALAIIGFGIYFALSTIMTGGKVSMYNPK